MVKINPDYPCRVFRCQEVVESGQIMCKQHWAGLPQESRDNLTHAPGTHLKAVRACLDFYSLGKGENAAAEN